MACTSKEAALSKLTERGLMGDKRSVPLDQLDQFEQYNQQMTEYAKRVYNLSIEGNFFNLEYQAPNLNRHYPVYRVQPVDSYFEMLDIHKEHNSKLGRDKIQDDFFFNEYSAMPVGQTVTYNPTNYNDYIDYKKKLLQKVNNRLANTVAERKFNKTLETKASLKNLSDLKDKIETEIYQLENATNIFEQTMSVFNQDIDLIDKLLSSDVPTIENIQIAEDMLTYFDIISDYSSTNHLNNFIDVSDPSLIEEDVLEAINKLRHKILEQKTKIDNAKKEYLLQAIDQSENLKSLFPGTQSKEIRDNLLQDKSDISLLSMLFGTLDKEFTGQDSLLAQLIKLELERSRSKNKAFATDMMQKINDLQPRVKSKLLALGYGISTGLSNKIASEVNYELFYQTTPNGNKTGRLVSKFSGKWFQDISKFFRTNNEEMADAWQSKDYNKLNATLVKKYNWLNDRTDFIDLTRLPEIISNNDYNSFSSYFDATTSNAYKNELIAQIGQYNYNKIVEQQKDYLEDFMVFINQEQQNMMSRYNVSNLEDLPIEAVHQYNITLKRNSPFEFIQSHKSGQQGRVDYTIGTNGNQYQSHLKYNSFIPKAQLERVNPANGQVNTSPSGYYDANFNTIEKDQDLLSFWEILSDSSEFMNATLNDARTSLSHNSLLRMTKSMTDILLDKNNGLLNKTGAILSETGQTLKNLISTNVQKAAASDITEVNKGGIETIEAEVSNRYNVFLYELSVIKGDKVTSRTAFSSKTITVPEQKLLEQATGIGFNQILNKHGVSRIDPVTNERFFTLYPGFVREYITNQVMEEQTFNLPVMMRAYLDLVSEYKAQKDALPKINIYKGLYDNIKLAKKEKRSGVDTVEDIAMRITRKGREAGLQDKRTKAQLRVEHWINKNVKGVEDKEYWVKFGRNLTEQQKDFKKKAEDYLKLLEDKLAVAPDEKAATALMNEIDDIKYQIENLGLTYTMAAIYNTVINRMSILVGLSWNIPSQVANRFQGWWQGMVSDTGRFWTAGNFYTANAFVNRKGLRRVPGANQFRNEVNKAKLFIEKLNIIQDATNELDRARRESGFTGITKKFNPFYLTEYTEWHNQTPQILAMIMDQTITDTQGNTVQVFDGHSFPAYNIVNGRLVLKPEFRTEDNIATWENFSNNTSADIKSKMSSTIASLNGDYSRTGSTVIKSKALGKTAMMFKTWLPNQIFLRFAKNQTDLTLGLQNFDGAYTGALSNKNSLAAGSLGIGSIAAVSGVMGLGLGFGLAIPAALAGYTMYNSIKSKRNDGENLETLTQLSQMGQAILKKFIGLPINTISGKNLIEAHKLGKLNITEQEKQNLHFIVNELTGLLWLTLFKVMIKGMLGDDDDKEPKTIDGTNPNPYYPGDLPTQREKEFYNVAENMVTRLIDDSTLYANPDAMWTSMMHPAGMDSWFKKVEKISDGLKRKIIDGTDELQTGPNTGRSKLGTALGDVFLPGVINEWVKGDADHFGFGKYAQQEWKKGEVLDGLSAFNSDYKLDRKALKSERADKKEELDKYWSKEFGLNEEQDPATIEILQQEVDKLVKQELDLYYPLNARYLYDETQEKIE